MRASTSRDPSREWRRALIRERRVRRRGQSCAIVSRVGARGRACEPLANHREIARSRRLRGCRRECVRQPGLRSRRRDRAIRSAVVRHRAHRVRPIGATPGVGIRRARRLGGGSHPARASRPRSGQLVHRTPVCDVGSAGVPAVSDAATGNVVAVIGHRIGAVSGWSMPSSRWVFIARIYRMHAPARVGPKGCRSTPRPRTIRANLGARRTRWRGNIVSLTRTQVGWGRSRRSGEPSACGRNEGIGGF